MRKASQNGPTASKLNSVRLSIISDDRVGISIERFDGELDSRDCDLGKGMKQTAPWREYISSQSVKKVETSVSPNSEHNEPRNTTHGLTTLPYFLARHEVLYFKLTRC